MIAPQELRLGNWVNVSGTGQIVEMRTVATLNQSANTYMPIPIDADLLEQFGFHFHSHFKIWQRNKPLAGTGPEMELDRDFWVLDFSHHRIGVELKSLHQLQNLYFSLQGKELTPRTTLVPAMEASIIS